MKRSPRTAALTLLMFLASVVGVARGQVAPQQSVHATAGPGAGLGASVSPVGSFPAAVPLDLPSSRGRLPLPLSIVYTGGTAAGAAGAGWDVPLSYVRRSNSTWRRKPAFAGSGPEHAVERMYVSLAGSAQLMVPHGDVYVPFVATEYSELRQDGAVWRLRTLDNIEYVFAPSASVGDAAWDGDPDLWMLTEIRDLTGTDRVVLQYTTTEGCGDEAELNLAGMSYGFDATGDVPLYEVKLGYALWTPGGNCRYFGAVHDDGLHFRRTRLLQDVAVYARNNLEQQDDPAVIRSYDLIYSDAGDLDLGTPRLLSVTQAGENGSDVEDLPLGSYTYGTLSAPPSSGQGSRIVEFGGWTEVPRPPEFEMMTSFENDIATSSTEEDYIYHYCIENLPT